MLLCPNCQKPLYKEDKSYRCPNGHSFDIAKEGYVNLLVHTQKKTGDDKDMVKARFEFFKKDFYHPLKEKMIELIKAYDPKIVVDEGCGEGYYTNAIADALNAEVYGFDMSKHALKRAAKQTDKVTYCAANLFYMPLDDQSVDLVYSIFTPLSMPENRRILKEGGIFIKAGPHERHLYELKEVVYDKAYLNPLKEVKADGFIKIGEERVEALIKLDNEDIRNLFMMTPYVHKSPQEGIQRLYDLSDLKVTIAFRIEIFKKNS